MIPDKVVEVCIMHFNNKDGIRKPDCIKCRKKHGVMKYDK